MSFAILGRVPGGITVHRGTIQRDTNGQPVRTTTTLTLEASVQPTNGRDQQLLPEGKRTVQTYKVYTREPLRVAEPATAASKTPVATDLVVYQGRTYEVISTEAWVSMGGSVDHYKSFIAEIGNDGGR